MSRSGYTECDDWDETIQWAQIRHAGARKAALRGARGQAFLRRLAAALDAMPMKSLIAIPDEDEDDVNDTPTPGTGRLGTPDGRVCVLGSLAAAEGKDPAQIDATDHKALSSMFNVAPTIIRDLEWENDQFCVNGEERWTYLRKWVTEHLATSLLDRTTNGGS